MADKAAGVLSVASIAFGIVNVGLSITTSVLEEKLNKKLEAYNAEVKEYMNTYSVVNNWYLQGDDFKTFADKWLAYFNFLKKVELKTATNAAQSPDFNYGLEIATQIVDFVENIFLIITLGFVIRQNSNDPEQAAVDSENLAQNGPFLSKEAVNMAAKVTNIAALASAAVASIMDLANLSMAINSLVNESESVDEAKKQLDSSKSSLDKVHDTLKQQNDNINDILNNLMDFLRLDKQSEQSDNIAAIEAAFMIGWGHSLRNINTHIISGCMYRWKEGNDEIDAKQFQSRWNDIYNYRPDDSLKYDLSLYVEDGDKISVRTYNWFLDYIFLKDDKSTAFDVVSTYLSTAKNYYVNRPLLKNENEDSLYLCLQIFQMVSYFSIISLSDYRSSDFDPTVHTIGD